MLEGLVDGIRLVLDRRDARRRPAQFDDRDMHTALIEFHEVADRWGQAAWQLTDGIRRWQHAGGLDDQQDAELVRLQLNKLSVVDDFVRWSDALARQLRIYAPELERELRAISERSARDVRDMTGELARLRRQGSKQAVERAVQGIEDRTHEVSDLIDQLREYVRDTYPLGPAR
jgi:hypothetical protein